MSVPQELASLYVEFSLDVEHARAEYDAKPLLLGGNGWKPRVDYSLEQVQLFYERAFRLPRSASVSRRRVA